MIPRSRPFVILALASLISIISFSLLPLQAEELTGSGSLIPTENIVKGKQTALQIANTSSDDGLDVYLVDGDVRHGNQNTNNANLTTTQRGARIIKTQRLRIAGNRISEATLRFFVNGTLRNSPLIAVGRSNLISQYFYRRSSCEGAGEFTIGWSAVGAESECKNFNYRPSGSDPEYLGPGIRSRHKIKRQMKRRNKNNEFKIDFQNYIDAAAGASLHYYSSAVDPITGYWGVALSEKPMSGNPVEGRSVAEESQRLISETRRKAIEICGEQGGEACEIVREDHWRSNVPDNLPELKQTNLWLRCRNRDYYKISGVEVEQMSQSLAELETEASADQSCTFSVRAFYDLIISPLDNERTLVHTGITEQGYVIDALVGSVRITLPGDPEITEAIDLRTGDRFFFDSLLDSFEKQPKESIPNSERQDAASYPIVKTFLDKSKWPTELGPEIEAYQNALQEQFLPPISSESLNVTVNGKDYQLWKAAVNLANSNTAFSLVRDCNVTGESSFRNFAQEQRAALVMGGIFSRQNRCEPTNFPLYSEGRLVSGSAQDWTQGTVFSISAEPGGGLTSDMRTYNAKGAYPWSSNEPQWGNYLFAVTSGPRLVANGQVVYSRQAARDQGHGDRFVIDESSRTRRAALCLSRDKKTFYYVLPQTPDALDLREFSNVLRDSSVGCWDAVNLDGGAGPALAVDGDVKLPPGRQQPYLMVVYYTENAPSQVRNAWGFR